MKLSSKTKSLYFIVVGLLLISVIQILSHYLELSDFLKGIYFGLGIGLMISGIYIRIRKTEKLKVSDTEVEN